MVKERTNRLMAYRVEKGLYVQSHATTRAAAAYMARFGVPVHVSMRVLTTPNKRDIGGLEDAPFWFDIIRAAGPSYGNPAGFAWN